MARASDRRRGARVPGKARRDPSDQAAALYHVVYQEEGFEHAATALFALVRRAERTQPGKRRVLFLDIEGHRNAQGGYDPEMVELQQQFLFGCLLPYLSEVYLPLGIRVTNPHPQRADLPDELVIQPAEP
jgi:hypothetical protein